MTVDLHIHSTYSDGTLTPAQLVELALKYDLKAISITDHDTIEGTKEAIERGRNKNIEIIPGIEFSCVHGKEHMHLLGYYIDAHHKEIAETLIDIQQAREERNHKIILKLNELGVDISLDEVYQKSTVGQTGRPHIAQVLMEKKIISNIDSGFTRYLKKGRPAYVGRKVLQATTTISLIKRAGGIPVLAHPGSIDKNLKKIPRLLDELVPQGLQGIEVYYPIHTKVMISRLKAIADKYGLVMTGGSDYHGEIRPGTGLAGNYGFMVPDEVLQELHRMKRTNDNML